MMKKPTYEELLNENLRLKETIIENETKLQNYTKEKAFLDILLENVPNAIYFKDENSKFVKTSHSIVKAFGVANMSELIGKSDFDFFKKESAQKYFDEEQKIIETGKSILNNIHIEKRKTGKDTWAIITKMPLKDENGKIIGTFGISSDITERKEAEQIIRESEMKSRELNATKDKFFSIIAHDLKSPFSGMLGFSKLLAENFDKYTIKQQKEFANIIYQGIKNTHKLLENLLTWSRSQRGTIEFKPTHQNLLILVNETIELLKQSATNKSIKLINHISDRISVIADKDMLSTIIRNLIYNAIKFTPKEGEISLNANEYKTQNNTKYIEITVTDNGVGIAPETQKKLFSISESTSTHGTDNEAGTGLGLIICNEFIKKHGGKIWIESDEGKGSKFSFTLFE